MKKVQAEKKSQVFAKHTGARISPKKVAITMDLVRGKNLEDAKVTLAFDRTKASDLILKVVKSAEANAKSNMKMDTNNLFVSEIWVSPGPMYKRMKIAGRSRSRPILKRTSHIYVGLAEKGK